jgi:translocation and assembly module TamB
MGRAARALGILAVFTAAAALAIAVHVGLAPSRRLAASALTSLLSRTFTGKIVIERIDRLAVDGVEGVAASVYDDAGERVLSVYGLRARASAGDLVRMLAGRSTAGKGARTRKVDFVISRVRVEHADVVLAANDNGQITIARAFTPRPTSGPPKAGGGGEVSVWLPEIEIGSAEVVGRIASGQTFSADLAGVHGSVLAGSDRTSIRVQRYSMRGQASGFLPAALDGTARTQIEMPSSTGAKISVWGTFDGFLGDLQVGVRAGLDGKNLEIVLDVPTARNDAMRGILPSLPLREDGSLHVEARGQLPDLDVKGGATIGRSRVAITGAVTTAPEPSARLDVDLRAVDLRSFALSAPETSITGSAHVDARLSGEHHVEGSTALTLQPFRVGELDIPALSATLELGPAGLEGRATSDGDALRSRVDFRVLPSPVGAPWAIDWSWSARTADVARVPWLRVVGSGQAQWQAQGHIADGRLDARVSGDVSGWSRSGFVLERARLTGSVRGPFAGLVLSSQMRGEGLRVANLYWQEVEATVDGPLRRLSIAAHARGDQDLEVDAQAVLEGGTSLSALELSARRGDVALLGRVGSIEETGNGVALRDLALQGAGAPVHGSLFVGPEEWQVQLSSTEIDLAKLAKVARPSLDVRGLLTFDVDAKFGGRAELAHARAELRGGSLAGVDGIEGSGEAAIDAGQFTGGVNARLGALGAVTIAAPGARLAGPPWQAKSWTLATGKVEVRTETDLAKLASLPAARLTRLGNAAGMVWVRAGLSREDFEVHRSHAPSAQAAPPPDLDLLVWTDGLRADLGKAAGPLGPVIADVDGQLGLHVEGESGKADLTARIVDREGIFAALSMLAEVPWAHLLDQPQDAIATLERVPVTAHLSVPRRKLADYPATLRTGLLGGEVEAAADMSGSLRAPKVAAQLRGYRMQPPAGLTIPVDARVGATYDGAEAVVQMQALRDEGLVLDGSARLKVPIATLFGERKSGPAWDANGAARLVGFPLVGIPELAERDLTGLATGTLSFSNLASDPEANIALTFTNLKIDRAAFPRGVLSGRLSRGGLFVNGRLDQVQGGVSASASARVRWSGPLSPAIDRGAPLDVFVEARDLRAAALRPLLFKGIFTYFDARLNGTLHLRQERQGDIDASSAEGALELRDARFQIPEIGQQFQNGRANLTVDRTGEVKVVDVSADAAAGRFTASGSFALSGLRFAHGEGSLAVAKNEAIPLTLEGLSIGEAWGTLGARASMDGEHTVSLDFEVPTFHVDVPESSSRDLRSLADNPKIRAGVRGDDGKLVPLAIGAPEEPRAEDALRWHLVFALGNEVYLRRGSMMELTLGGQPVVDVTDKAHVSGSVDFRSGKVEVFGKQFEVEHGNARFVRDEPGNPDVSVTARWDSPDGTRIYADFVGPLHTGVLTLRSEPQRPQSEIFAILLLGSSDASDAAPRAPMQQDTSTQTAGAVLAGGAVSTSLNRVLSSVTPLDITTRVASDSQGFTPEVAVQITPKVTAQVSYRTRAPSPGEKPDQVFITLDWRFRRNWSVVTTFGNQQSSMLDLIWQYRY